MPGADRAARSGLRRMKTVATALLVLAAAAYAVSYRWRASGGPSWLGWVTAAGEAGMVGGLADWFAVTALFRHPLGLPIPHTALLRTRKDAVGRSLQTFVGRYFLSEEVVRSRIAAVHPARRAGGWLADGDHAERVAETAASALRGLSVTLREDDVIGVLQRAVLSRAEAWPVGPPAGRLLDALVTEGVHTPFIDLVAERAERWLAANPSAVRRLVVEQVPTWTPRFVDERIAERLHRELVRIAGEVRADRGHRLRRTLDAFLLRFARDLAEHGPTQDRLERLKLSVLAHGELAAALRDVLELGRQALLDAALDPASELRVRAVAAIRGFGTRLVEDEVLAGRLDRAAEDVISHLVTTYTDEITTIISETVERWDAGDASRRIELAVGRDLQYIRVNGTVVGAAAGLALHAVTVLLL